MHPQHIFRHVTPSLSVGVSRIQTYCTLSRHIYTIIPLFRVSNQGSVDSRHSFSKNLLIQYKFPYALILHIKFSPLVNLLCFLYSPPSLSLSACFLVSPSLPLPPLTKSIKRVAWLGRASFNGHKLQEF